MKSASRCSSKGNGRLDPLFDYSNIRPPMIVVEDDDDDDDVQILAPSDFRTIRNHSESTDIEVNAGSGIRNPPTQANNVVKVIDDNEWLEPPPSSPGCQGVLPVPPACSTLLKLRQHKAELQKIFTVSAESVRKMDEAGRLQAIALKSLPHQQPASCTVGNADSRSPMGGGPPSERSKVLLKLQGDSGKSHGVMICADDKLEKLFAHFADKIAKRPLSDFVFRFDGLQLDGNKTPKDLELEDEDIIEVFVKSAKR